MVMVLLLGELAERNPMALPVDWSSIPWCSIPSFAASSSPRLRRPGSSAIACSRTPRECGARRTRDFDLEHDRLDALAVEEVREHQACRPGADDADLRTH